MMTRGFIYILTNPDMPNVVNIGSTGRHPEDCALELSAGPETTSSFQVGYYGWSDDAPRDAAHIHEYLFDLRNRDTNFFTMSLERAVDSIESQLNVKRMYYSAATGSGDSVPYPRIKYGRSSYSVQSADDIVEDGIDDNVSSSARIIEIEKAQIIQQARDLDQHPDPELFEAAIDIGSVNDDQNDPLETKLQEDEQLNRERELKLHEDHIAQLNQIENDRLKLIESEKRKRASERRMLEEHELKLEAERKERALQKRLLIEQKLMNRRRMGSAIRIVGAFLIFAALLGYFWGSQGSNTSIGDSSFFSSFVSGSSE